MAGTKFQYDESGTTFYYFVLAFLTMIIAPCTYFFWPRESSSGGSEDDYSTGSRKHGYSVRCHCDPCLIKHHYMQQKEPSKTIRKRFTKIVLLAAWVVLIAFAYKVSEIQPDYVTFDPFEILGIDPASSSAEIKKAYRRLSLIYHPDKETGDEKKFMRITKAYAALTDEQARKNWEEYGNPDGPGAMSFGIALPSWIVEKENSVFVLMVYVLMLMIVLPVCVRIWWSNSSKYGDFKVLIDTSQLYFFFINKNPHMILRRVLMIICASYEYEKSHNSEIVERPSDNTEIPKLMKQIPNLGMNNRVRPLCYEYSLKARTLLYAHLLRMPLPSVALQHDQKYILTKIAYLIQEFVQCSQQLTFLYLAQRIPRCPHLETMENAMKLNGLVVQALWINKSCMLQLPHIQEDMLRYFSNRRRNVRTMQHLAKMPDHERRSMLNRLSDEQYSDLLNVLGRMPLLEVDVRSEVIDDEDTATITAGALVTVTVKLTRKPMSTLFQEECTDTADNNEHSINHVTNDAGEEGATEDGEVSKKQTSNSKPWEKSNRGNNKKNKQNKKKKQQVNNQKHSKQSIAPSITQSIAQQSVDEQEDSDSVAGTGAGGSDQEQEPEQTSSGVGQGGEQNDDDDDDWSIVKQNLPKKEIFKSVSKISHSVHCPYYPEDKQEHWWIYITDKKKMTLKTIPYFMTNLVQQEEVELKFIAPQEPGSYQYMVNVRCDSYVDLDYFKMLKLDVKEAPKEIVSHPQWEMSEEENEQQFDDDSAASDSDLVASDDEEEEEDDGEHDMDDDGARFNSNAVRRFQHDHDDDEEDDEEEDDE